MVQTNFRYDKESIFAEFKAAKEKDAKLSKKKTQEERENDVYKNRIALLKEYIKLEAEMPEVFSEVDINFQKLLNLYLTPNPRDAFYMAFFGKTYAEKREESRVKTMRDYSVSEKVNHAKDEILEI